MHKDITVQTVKTFPEEFRDQVRIAIAAHADTETMVKHIDQCKKSLEYYKREGTQEDIEVLNDTWKTLQEWVRLQGLS